MKVMLLIPPNSFSSKAPLPSLGIAYVAAVLKQNNLDVFIIDSPAERINKNQLKEIFRKTHPDIVGISCLTEYRFEAFESAKLVKQVIPNTVVWMGGPHATFTAQDILKNVDAVDLVLQGEVEGILSDVIHNFNEEQNYDHIPGTTYRNKGTIVNNPLPMPITKLDTLPFPAWELLPMDKYRFTLNIPEKGEMRAMHLITSRGCPCGCSFCITSQMSGRKWRFHSPDRVLGEIKELMRLYNVNAFWFYDDTFTMNQKRIMKICELIKKEGLKIHFTCSIRVDTVNYELLKIMKEAGCFKVFFGVESSSQHILDDVCGKKIKLEQVREVSHWCDMLGIIKNPGFIIGFPKETYEEARNTIKFAKAIGGETSLSFLRIYPGTKIATVAKEKGILPSQFSWSIPDKRVLSIPIAHGESPLFSDLISTDQLLTLAFEWAKKKREFLWKRAIRVFFEVKSLNDINNLFKIGSFYLIMQIKSVTRIFHH